MSFIVGRKPVLEAINSGEEIEQVYILYGQKGRIVDAIRVAAKKRGIKINQATPEKFKALTDHPNTQGIIARKSSHKFYSYLRLKRRNIRWCFCLIQYRTHTTSEQL